MGVAEMAPWFRTLAAISEDPCLIPRTHMSVTL